MKLKKSTLDCVGTRVRRVLIVAFVTLMLSASGSAAFANTTTTAACLAAGHEVVDHGAWKGCADGTTSGTLIVDP